MALWEQESGEGSAKRYTTVAAKRGKAGMKFMGYAWNELDKDGQPKPEYKIDLKIGDTVMTDSVGPTETAETPTPAEKTSS